MRRSAIAPTTRCASTAASCAARSSAKAATSAARSSGASSSRWRAAASTPTRSTTRPASTPPTTRSTSRSCSAWPIADGELTEKQRNALLAEMTDDVAALVLRDNYFQTQALSVTGRIAPQLLDAQQRFIQYLEKGGRLNRAIEFLPADEEIADAARAGPRPDQPRARGAARLQQDLALRRAARVDAARRSVGRRPRWCATFPQPLRERYAALHAAASAEARDHRHARHQQHDQPRRQHVRAPADARRPARKPHEIVRAYLLSREIFGFVSLWQAIEALDNKVDDAVQSAMLIDTSRLLERGTTWFLRSRRLADDMGATIAHFAPRRRGAGRRACRSCSTPPSARASTPRSPRYVGAGRAAASWRRAWSRSTRSTRRSTSSRSRTPRSGRSSSSPRSTSTSSTRLGAAVAARRIAALPGDAALADAGQGRDAGRSVRPAADDRRRGAGRRAMPGRPRC